MPATHRIAKQKSPCITAAGLIRISIANSSNVDVIREE